MPAGAFIAPGPASTVFPMMTSRSRVVAITMAALALLGLGAAVPLLAEAAGAPNTGCVSAKDRSHVVHAFLKCPAGYYAANLAGTPVATVPPSSPPSSPIAGPQGPKGDKGEKGDTGPAGKNAVSPVQLVTATVTVEKTTKPTLTVTLPEGARFVTAGADKFLDPTPSTLTVVAPRLPADLSTPVKSVSFTLNGQAEWPVGLSRDVTVWVLVLVR